MTKGISRKNRKIPLRQSNKRPGWTAQSTADPIHFFLNGYIFFPIAAFSASSRRRKINGRPRHSARGVQSARHNTFLCKPEYVTANGPPWTRYPEDSIWDRWDRLVRGKKKEKGGEERKEKERKKKGGEKKKRRRGNRVEAYLCRCFKGVARYAVAGCRQRSSGGFEVRSSHTWRLPRALEAHGSDACARLERWSWSK